MLNYLEGGETAKLGALRSATGANKALLDGMVKKKWLVREALAEERDARRLEKVAVLVDGAVAGEEKDKSRSFDSASRDETARSSAQDDTSKKIGGLRLPRLNENQLAVMRSWRLLVGGCGLGICGRVWLGCRSLRWERW